MNFKDYCEKENPESVIKFSEVYFGDAKIELNKVEDLYPYYNHIISKMTSLNGYQKIYLGNSEIDEKEKDRVSREILKVLKLFKKNGKDFKNSIEINNSLISLICVIVENTPELKKFYLTKDEVKFIKDYFKARTELNFSKIFSAYNRDYYKEERENTDGSFKKIIDNIRYERIFVKSYDDIKRIGIIYSIPIGYNYIVVLTIYVDGRMHTATSHKLADEIEKKILKDNKRIKNVIVHIEPFIKKNR